MHFDHIIYSYHINIIYLWRMPCKNLKHLNIGGHLCTFYNCTMVSFSIHIPVYHICLLYTSDAADDMQCVDLGGRRIIKKCRAAVARVFPRRWQPDRFFQAEDGIRDVERSRGLGDVYKRQVGNFNWSIDFRCNVYSDWKRV